MRRHTIQYNTNDRSEYVRDIISNSKKMALLCELPVFWGNNDSFPKFYDHLEQAFEANGIDREKRKTWLFTCFEGNIRRTLKAICHPDSPTSKTYDELCELLKRQYNPRAMAYRARFEFYNAQQRTEDCVQEWYGRIKELSLDCSFGDRYSEILLDRFISGMMPSAIRDRICEEEMGHLEIEHALEIATDEEALLQKTN